MKLYMLVTFEEESMISDVGFLRLKVTEDGKETEVFSMFHKDGKDTLISDDITKEQFKELTGGVKWARPHTTYLSEYAANVLSQHLKP